MDEIREKYMLIYPPYLHEMEFVRFDAVLIDDGRSYIWLGYSPEDDAYFFCFKLFLFNVLMTLRYCLRMTCYFRNIFNGCVRQT